MITVASHSVSSCTRSPFLPAILYLKIGLQIIVTIKHFRLSAWLSFVLLGFRNTAHQFGNDCFKRKGQFAFSQMKLILKNTVLKNTVTSGEKNNRLIILLWNNLTVGLQIIIVSQVKSSIVLVRVKWMLKWAFTCWWSGFKVPKLVWPLFFISSVLSAAIYLMYYMYYVGFLWYGDVTINHLK